MNSTEYKKYHEAFMQDNHGSTAVHTFLCIFFTVQSSIYISIQNGFPTYKQYIYEYFVIVLPMILAHTVLAEYIVILNFILFGILLHKVLFHYKNAIKKFTTKNILKSDRIPLISTLRGLTYLITVLCILAVDFRDFPRYLAKTEKYGYSLMDTGVGLFVSVSGIVHKDLRRNSIKDIVKSNLKIVGILLLLGIGRFVSVKQLDYPEHVTEYGVHWNFFFTIAVCKIISTFVLYLSNHALLLSILILTFHEFVLYIGLHDWVFSNNLRASLISANREGITSCLGYVSIYLFAVHIRHVLLNKNIMKHEILVRLVFRTVLLWAFVYCNVTPPTSRTLANAGYCIFVDALLVTITTVVYFITVLCEEKGNIQIPLILSMINGNGLIYFLIANLLTGAINLSIRTLFMPSYITLVILNIYMLVTLLVIVFVNKLGFSI